MRVLTGTKVGKSINLKVAVRAAIGAVLRDDQTVRGQGRPCVTSKDITFDKHLVVASAVDGLVQEILVQVVVDVLVTKATGGTASTGVPPIVVVVSDMKMTSIDGPQCIAVANQRTLPVVVEVVPGDSDPIRSSYDI